MLVMLSHPLIVFAFSAGDPARFLIERLEPLVNDYGMAIVLSVLIVRILLLPLTIAQARNSQLMRQIKPDLDAIKQEYASDPAQIRKAQQERMQAAGFNPLAGCFSFIIIGLVFYSFYSAIHEIPRLGQEAPFWGRTWIDSLDDPDRFFRLKMNLPFFGRSFHLLPLIPVLFCLVRDGVIKRDVEQLTHGGALGMSVLAVFLYHIASAEWIVLLTFLSVGVVEDWFMPKLPEREPTTVPEDHSKIDSPETQS